MEQQPTKCVKCGGDMAEGFILDRIMHGVAAVATWQADKPERSFWTGIKFQGKEQREITVYRCEECGFLESYAK
jgi:Domain of unknown function (DUF6487)